MEGKKWEDALVLCLRERAKEEMRVGHKIELGCPQSRVGGEKTYDLANIASVSYDCRDLFA